MFGAHPSEQYWAIAAIEAARPSAKSQQLNYAQPTQPERQLKVAAM